jgi:energy-coupling factor transporter ATP-binding protein EcfA2
MFRNLKLEQYRSFESYELSGLTRVNLLVGKNNCGKTSILEAVNLLVSEGSPAVIEQCADRRGEMNLREDAESSYNLDMVPDVSHLFLGRVIEPEVGFHLCSDDATRSLSIEIADVEDVTENADHQDIGEMLSLFDEDESEALALVTRINGQSVTPFLPVDQDGSVLAMPPRRKRPKKISATPPVQFVTAESLYPASMRSAWDSVLADGRESDVIDAMRILDEELDTIHFLTRGVFRGSSERSGVLIGLRTGGQRVPLGSCGDGMRRLLALSLSLIRAADGFLLIDEIDTGLHWTAMEETWRLIVTAARRSNVQVFATTHSYDCVRGLASLVDSLPDLAADVSIQKIDRLLNEAVSLDAEKIRIAVAQDMEVR